MKTSQIVESLLTEKWFSHDVVVVSKASTDWKSDITGEIVSIRKAGENKFKATISGKGAPKTFQGTAQEVADFLTSENP